jgi:phage FluMu protein Com
MTSKKEKTFRPPIAQKGKLNLFIKKADEDKVEDVKMEMCVICGEEIVPENRGSACDKPHYTCIMCTCQMQTLRCNICNKVLTKFSFIRGVEEHKENIKKAERIKKAMNEEIAERQARQAARGEEIEYV